MNVSVVIPTRNRARSLTRLLRSLSLQTHPLAEVIIVDASEPSLQLSALQGQFPRLSIRLFHSKPSVCAQRNLGIREAASDYIFLCDDDMEVPQEYVWNIMSYLSKNIDSGAVSGLVSEPKENGTFNDGFYPVSLSTLVSNFIFQNTVWTDLDKMNVRFPGSLLLFGVRQFYKGRGNTFTLAGWPLLTEVQHPITRTAIYGLGGSIIRKDWLTRSPFDESLDESGIGDNYGVSLGFPGTMPIAVLTNIPIYHHKVPDNRLARSEAYLRRVLALDYFMSKNERFSVLNRLLLRWSVVGNLLGSLLNGQREMSSAAFQTLWMLLRNENPYMQGQRAFNMGMQLHPGTASTSDHPKL